MRRELTEAANAIDRYDEGKGTIDDVLAEVRDVLYVWQSVVLSEEVKEANVRNCWREHERCADEKLRQAIEDKLRFNQ